MIKFLNPCLNIQKNMINFEKKFKLFKLLKKNKKKVLQKKSKYFRFDC